MKTKRRFLQKATSTLLRSRASFFGTIFSLKLRKKLEREKEESDEFFLAFFRVGPPFFVASLPSLQTVGSSRGEEGEAHEVRVPGRPHDLFVPKATTCRRTKTDKAGKHRPKSRQTGVYTLYPCLYIHCRDVRVFVFIAMDRPRCTYREDAFVWICVHPSTGREGSTSTSLNLRERSERGRKRERSFECSSSSSF